jgi:hypothetical protein
MRFANPTMNEPGFITLCIEMAQSTFSDVMPRPEPRARAASSRTTADRTTKGRSWTSAFSDWIYRQQLKDREAYLAKSVDVFDLERRIRQLDQRPYY